MKPRRHPEAHGAFPMYVPQNSPRHRVQRSGARLVRSYSNSPSRIPTRTWVKSSHHATIDPIFPMRRGDGGSADRGGALEIGTGQVHEGDQVRLC